MATGLISQIMYGEESTWGTRVVPNIAIPLKSETLTKDLARLESEGIIPGFSILSADQWNGGPTTGGGTIQHELHASGIDVLLKHMFGSQTNTGSGPYTHTFTPADLTDMFCRVEGVPRSGCAARTASSARPSSAADCVRSSGSSASAAASTSSRSSGASQPG